MKRLVLKKVCAGGRLTDRFESRVLVQGLRDADALGCLVVFQHCGYDPRQGERRAVEGVGQLDTVVGVAVAQLHTVALEGFEIGYGADLQPALLCARPYLEIEGFG